MKVSLRFMVVLVGLCGALGLVACSDLRSRPIASSGRSGCNNINMSTADMRNDPANGLTPTPH